MKKRFLISYIALMVVGGFVSCNSKADKNRNIQPLAISDTNRFLMTRDGKPFFWMGDTAWLLCKLDREQMQFYVQNRKNKGFNVIQTSVLHYLDRPNAYGDFPLEGLDASKPLLTPGNDPDNPDQYDYWDHWDYLIELAMEHDMYVAIVPVWGTNVKNGSVDSVKADHYSRFLAQRWNKYPNIVWLNGGDIKGSDKTEIWHIMGNNLKKYAPNHLVTFHPFGRDRSSRWFHEASWLDFNMVQSGHRTYEQDPDGIGQDNWKYLQIDYNLRPIKPTIDGEPSYENIPHGLHNWHDERNIHLRPKDYDANQPQPLWGAADLRRYAYWSVFAGGFGFTYGHNAVMQMRDRNETGGAYGSKEHWEDALEAEGATQMRHLINLILSRPYFERVPDQSLVVNQKEKYGYVAATRGNGYAFLYTFSAQPFQVNMGKISGVNVKSSWMNPRTGDILEGGIIVNTGVHEFSPPVSGDNDWVLILDSV
jgi:hypothetical protein